MTELDNKLNQIDDDLIVNQNWILANSKSISVMAIRIHDLSNIKRAFNEPPEKVETFAFLTNVDVFLEKYCFA